MALLCQDLPVGRGVGTSGPVTELSALRRLEHVEGDVVRKARRGLRVGGHGWLVERGVDGKWIVALCGGIPASDGQTNRAMRAMRRNLS